MSQADQATPGPAPTAAHETDARPGENAAQMEALQALTAAFTFEPAGREKEALAEDDFDDFDDFDAGFDELETALLGEDYSANAQLTAASAAQLAAKVNLSKSVQNDIVRSEKTLEKKKTHTGRDDRATVEQVLDPRTRLILFKFLSTGFLECIDGCLSTGKEANVYYARYVACAGLVMMWCVVFSPTACVRAGPGAVATEARTATSTRSRSTRRPSWCSRTETSTCRATTA